MKISTTFHKKVPVPGLEYASQGFHLTLEAEPSPEVQENREKLRRYIQALFQECRERVEQELAETREPVRSNGHTNGASSRRRQFDASRRVRSNGSAATNGRNGQNSNGRATPKQLNFARSLATQVGMSYEELADLAAEHFGKTDLRTLSKREASQLIDELRE